MVVLLFGPRRLPGIARTLGRSVREVRTPFGEAKRLLELDPPAEQQAPPASQAPPAQPPAVPPSGA